MCNDNSSDMNINKNAVYMRSYRQKNPEYYNNDCLKKNERYLNDPDFREKMKQNAKERYLKLKLLKQNNNILI